MSTSPLSSDPVTTPAPLERSPRSLPPSTASAIAGGGAIGATTGAALGSAFGPAGVAVGAIGGAIVGGLAGKGVAESTTPTDESQYWSTEHAKQPFAAGRPYELFMEAYKVGYQRYSRSEHPLVFEAHEPELRREYEEKVGPDGLPWEEARPAAKAAWERLAHHDESLIDCTVLDQAKENAGRVHTLWRLESGRAAFAGVTTTWLLGNVHVVPLHAFEYDHVGRTVRFPFDAKLIHAAPTVESSAHLSPEIQDQVCHHFDLTVASVLAEHMESPRADR